MYQNLGLAWLLRLGRPPTVDPVAALICLLILVLLLARKPLRRLLAPTTARRTGWHQALRLLASWQVERAVWAVIPLLVVFILILLATGGIHPITPSVPAAALARSLTR